MDYKAWLQYMSQRTGRDVSQDAHDYDLEGYYNSLKFNPGEAGAYDPKTKEAHLTSEFKLPNHTTFSDESIHHVPVIKHGGQWVKPEQEGGQWTFKPSQHNIENSGLEKLQKYFNGPAESNPQGLDVPSNELQSKARTEALRKLSNGR